MYIYRKQYDHEKGEYGVVFSAFVLSEVVRMPPMDHNGISIPLLNSSSNFSHSNKSSLLEIKILNKGQK